jgi:hypothetical protein
MGVVYACAFSFMSKYLYQYCGPKPMTRVDINENNQSSNKNIKALQYESFDLVLEKVGDNAYKLSSGCAI